MPLLKSKDHKLWSLLAIFNIKKKIYTGIVLLLVLFFFILPIAKLAIISFNYEGKFSILNYYNILLEDRTWDTLKNTLIIVLSSSLLALIIGTTLAWLTAYTDIRGKKIIKILLFIPFVIPSYIISLSWIQLINSAELFSELSLNIYSYGGIIFVMGICHCPLIFLMTETVFRKIPRDLEFAGRTCGCSRFKVICKITLPMAVPGISSGCILTFLASLSNFGIPAFLGIPANINVLNTVIYQEIVGFSSNSFNRAATLASLLGVIALLGSLILWYFSRKSKILETFKEDYQPRIFLGKYRIIIEIITWLFLLSTSIIPLLAMIKTSVIKAYGLDFIWKNLTLDHYKFILWQSNKTISAIKNSLLLAIITTIVCLILGTMIAYYRVRKKTIVSRMIEIVVSIPYALPGIVFALAIILIWIEPIPGWSPGIYGTVKLIFIAYIIRFLILQIRGSITSILQVDISMEEAARLSGANLIIRWKEILWPLLYSGVLGAALLVFVNVLTELTVSSILWSSGSETIGVVIFNLEQAGYTSYSTAFSSLIVIMISLCFVVFNIVNKYSRSGVKTQ
ncbi:iron ABC transporter permease [Halocella sp. SP3-1]|uniref:ABC transporter permease n=1 Tax=Halocella sp. SP3-1 TaxID=2382161 RepID=UPI000F7571B5|nr:iron ABC transporter permease [Halocella sp. SP3-1]AZO95779.1 iron ABC transporter permease [Halocella sp. SP3-1]